MYFLRYFIRLNKTVIYESVEGRQVWVYSPNGCRSFEGVADTDNCEELLNSETYYLFESLPGNYCHEPVSCPAFLLLFSSTNDIITFMWQCRQSRIY
jgi:hypothetical protein